jgi:amidase
VRDLPFQSAADQLSAPASGKVSSEELLEVFLSRIDAHNETLNAIVTLDVERARHEARNADAKRARGAELGPLHGLPITLKDSYETAGLRTVCGRAHLKDYVPDQDAEVVRRLRTAGALIIGKTNVPAGNQDVQADNPVFGPTLNPWNTARTSGGSAGGGAVATAAGLTAFDFGSEIGGSTRIPAHFNASTDTRPPGGPSRSSAMCRVDPVSDGGGRATSPVRAPRYARRATSSPSSRRR